MIRIIYEGKDHGLSPRFVISNEDMRKEQLRLWQNEITKETDAARTPGAELL